MKNLVFVSDDVDPSVFIYLTENVWLMQTEGNFHFLVLFSVLKQMK